MGKLVCGGCGGYGVVVVIDNKTGQQTSKTCSMCGGKGTV